MLEESRNDGNVQYMNIVLDKMSVVNVGAARTIISLTASTSSSDHSAPVICSVFNDEKSEPDRVSGSISANPTLMRVRDSRLLNLEKRDKGKCITFSKWSAVKEGRLTRFPIMDEGVLGLFQWNSPKCSQTHPNFCRQHSCFKTTWRLSVQT